MLIPAQFYSVPFGNEQFFPRNDSRLGDFDEIAAQKFSQKRPSSLGLGCSVLWWSHHSWNCSQNVWMWHVGTWVSGGLGSAGGTAGLSNHRGLSQSKQFHDSSSVCTLSIPYTFPKTKGKGKYRIFPGLKTKATRKQTYTENFWLNSSMDFNYKTYSFLIAI